MASYEAGISYLVKRISFSRFPDQIRDARNEMRARLRNAIALAQPGLIVGDLAGNLLAPLFIRLAIG